MLDISRPDKWKNGGVVINQDTQEKYPQEIATIVGAAQPLAGFLGGLTADTCIGGIHLNVDARHRIHTIKIYLDSEKWLKFTWFINDPGSLHFEGICCSPQQALGLINGLKAVFP